MVKRCADLQEDRDYIRYSLQVTDKEDSRGCSFFICWGNIWQCMFSSIWSCVNHEYLGSRRFAFEKTCQRNNTLSTKQWQAPNKNETEIGTKVCDVALSFLHSSSFLFRRYAAEDIIMSRGCRAAYIHVAASGVAELLLFGPCDVVWCGMIW